MPWRRNGPSSPLQRCRPQWDSDPRSSKHNPRACSGFLQPPEKEVKMMSSGDRLVLTRVYRFQASVSSCAISPPGLTLGAWAASSTTFFGFLNLLDSLPAKRITRSNICSRSHGSGCALPSRSSGSGVALYGPCERHLVNDGFCSVVNILSKKWQLRWESCDFFLPHWVTLPCQTHLPFIFPFVCRYPISYKYFSTSIPSFLEIVIFILIYREGKNNVTLT